MAILLLSRSFRMRWLMPHPWASLIKHKSSDQAQGVCRWHALSCRQKMQEFSLLVDWSFRQRILAHLLFEVKWSEVKATQSCPILCHPMDYTVYGILQARILEWVAFPFSRGSSQPRDQTQVSHIAGGFFTSWATYAQGSVLRWYICIISFKGNHRWWGRGSRGRGYMCT